jgi:TRAP-type C4-dicarboxylate transport system permease small subunit
MNSPADDGHASPDEPALPEGPVERICGLLGELTLVVMIVLIMTEIVTRGVFNFSFEIIDEVGGYLLVALAFLSLPVCVTGRAFHRVEFVLVRLSPRGRATISLVFTGVILFAVLVLDYYLARVVVQSYDQESLAMTRLATPFWIPQLFMPLGTTALAFTLTRRLVHDARRMIRAGKR